MVPPLGPIARREPCGELRCQPHQGRDVHCQVVAGVPAQRGRRFERHEQRVPRRHTAHPCARALQPRPQRDVEPQGTHRQLLHELSLQVRLAVADPLAQHVLRGIDGTGRQPYQRARGAGVMRACGEAVLGRDLHIPEVDAPPGAKREGAVPEADRVAHDDALEAVRVHRVARQEQCVAEGSDAEGGQILLDRRDGAANALASVRAVARQERLERGADRVHRAVERIPHGTPVCGAVLGGARLAWHAAVHAVCDVLVELGEGGVELREEALVAPGCGAIRDPRVQAEVRALRGELHRRAGRDPDDRHHKAHRQPLAEPQLGLDRVGAALLAHAEASLAQACHESCHATRQPYVLLEPRHRGDVGAADRVARQAATQAEPADVGELGVPGHDPWVEREADHAALGDVGALHGLGGEHGPAREDGAEDGDGESEGSHSETAPARWADAVVATPRPSRGSRQGISGIAELYFVLIA